LRISDAEKPENEIGLRSSMLSEAPQVSVPPFLGWSAGGAAWVGRDGVADGNWQAARTPAPTTRVDS
jgi:hypothetical protein